MQFIPLDFGGHDAERLDDPVNIFRKCGNVADNLEYAPRRNDVRDGGDDVMRRDFESVLGDDAKAGRTVNDDKIVIEEVRLLSIRINMIKHYILLMSNHAFLEKLKCWIS